MRVGVGVGVGGAGETGDCRQQPGLRLQDVSVIICDISLSRMVKPVPSRPFHLLSEKNTRELFLQISQMSISPPCAVPAIFEWLLTVV